MRLVVAALRRQPRLARRALIGSSQSFEPLRRPDAGEDGPRLAAAETAETGHLELERRRHDLAERRLEVPRRGPVHIADEAQGEVIVLGIDPARAGEPGTKHGQALGDAFRNLDGGKESGHWRSGSLTQMQSVRDRGWDSQDALARYPQARHPAV